MSNFVTANVEMRRETPKAILVYNGLKDVWIPKSQLQSDVDNMSGTVVGIILPEWLAKANGLEYEKSTNGYSNQKPQNTRTYKIPDDVWGNDPEFSRADWGYEASQNDTNLGYWEWVAHRREAAENDRGLNET